jgi:PST family polysaccharide transporter
LAVLMTGRTVQLGLALIATALLTRILGPAGFGQYRSAVAYLGLVVVLADLGLASIFVRSISRPGADQKRLVANALALRLVVALATMALAVGIAFFLPLEESVQLAVAGGAAGFVAYSLHLLLFGLFQQRLRQQSVMMAEISGGLVLLACIGVLWRMGADPIWFVVALGLSYIATLSISLLAARHLVELGLSVDWQIWRDYIKAALPLAGAATFSIVYVRADIVFLAILQPAEVVGLYGVPIKIFDALMGLALLYAGLFAPLFGRTAASDLEAFGQYLETSLLALIIGAVGVALALNVLAEQLVVLLGGAQFAGAAGILKVLGVMFVLHATTILFRECVTALGLQTRLVRGYALGLVVAFVAYMNLIPALGGAGAAISLVLAEVVVVLYVFFVIKGVTGHRVRFLKPLLAVICGLVCAGASEALLLRGMHWGVVLPVVLALFGVLLLVTKCLDLGELQKLIVRTRAP